LLACSAKASWESKTGSLGFELQFPRLTFPFASLSFSFYSMKKVKPIINLKWAKNYSFKRSVFRNLQGSTWDSPILKKSIELKISPHTSVFAFKLLNRINFQLFSLSKLKSDNFSHALLT
jgi:hypothetical protein